MPASPLRWGFHRAIRSFSRLATSVHRLITFERRHRAITNPCPCFLGVPVVVDASVRRRLSFPVPKPSLTFCLLDQELRLFGSQIHRNPHRPSRPFTVSMSLSIIRLHTRYAAVRPRLTPMA